MSFSVCIAYYQSELRSMHWKRALSTHINEPHFTEHGFDQTGNAVWVIDPFPEDIKEIMFDTEFDEEGSSFGADVESENENDDDI